LLVIEAERFIGTRKPTEHKAGGPVVLSGSRVLGRESSEAQALAISFNLTPPQQVFLTKEDALKRGRIL
jgi:hypothetical protein